MIEQGYLSGETPRCLPGHYLPSLTFAAIFFNLSRKIRERNFNRLLTFFFQIIFNSSFITHLPVPRGTLQEQDGGKNRLQIEVK